MPGKDDFKRIVDERNAKVTFKPSQVTKSVVRQNSQVIQFVRQEESTDGDSEIVLMGFNWTRNFKKKKELFFVVFLIM